MLAIIVTLTLLHSISATLECPDSSPNWFVSGDSCYLVSLEPLSWFAAQEYCWSMGGYLAELTSMEEDIPLENYLIQGVYYWIGLSDAASEGTWRWMESHQKADYTNFMHGEPTSNGDCVFKSLQPGYLGWADYPCTQTAWNAELHALCET